MFCCASVLLEEWSNLYLILFCLEDTITRSLNWSMSITKIIQKPCYNNITSLYVLFFGSNWIHLQATMIWMHQLDSGSKFQKYWALSKVYNSLNGRIKGLFEIGLVMGWESPAIAHIAFHWSWTRYLCRAQANKNTYGHKYALYMG